MSLRPVPMEVTSISLSGINLTYVAVVGVIALIALYAAANARLWRSGVVRRVDQPSEKTSSVVESEELGRKLYNF